ncbi:MAG: hypothetical protein K2W95_00875 [Candidatus Obscuribacterales bacterium]|nr:hypothetical protein [Candidatus Obscuribacterales bacterium]
MKLFSGFRLQSLPPEIYPHAWEDLEKNAGEYLEYFQRALELSPFVVDDCLMHLTPEQLLFNALRHGEYLMCFHREHPAGFMGFLDISHQRSAKFEAFGDPLLRSCYRGRKILLKLAREAIEYAFKPFGPISEGGGLGLLKLKAEIARCNEPALKAARALGFRPVGVSPADGFYHSLPVDMVLLELLNPQFLRTLEASYVPQQEPANVVPDSADVHAAAGIRSTAGPADGSTTGDVGAKHSTKRKRSRKANSAMAAIHESEPDGPCGADSVRG